MEKRPIEKRPDNKRKRDDGNRDNPMEPERIGEPGGGREWDPGSERGTPSDPTKIVK
jgi:hypothetical protein